MKKTICLLLILLIFIPISLADVILGPENIDLTDREVKQYFSAMKMNARAQEISSNLARKIEIWLESRKYLAKNQNELDYINQAIVVTRALQRLESKNFADSAPTARTIKQATIDNEIASKQRVVDSATEFRDNLVDADALQEEIDAANVILDTANVELIAAQAITVEDFIVTP